MKKGRHRRFEEARKLKQSGPGAFDLGFGDRGQQATTTTERDEDDDYAALAEKYGVEFDDDDERPADEPIVRHVRSDDDAPISERSRRPQRRVGERHPVRALELLDQRVVDALADQLDDLVARRSVDRLGRRRTPRATRCTTSGTRRRPRPSRAASTRAAVT